MQIPLTVQSVLRSEVDFQCHRRTFITFLPLAFLTFCFRLSYFGVKTILTAMLF